MDSAKKKPKTIDEYLANVKPDHRKTLQKLRQTIQTAVPSAEECISYGIPAFRLNRRVLVFFGAWANHCSFYPGSAATLKNFRNELREFSNQQRDDSLLSGQTVAGRVGEEAGQNANRREERSSKQKE